MSLKALFLRQILMLMRTETDFLGEKQIPRDAFYGIHSVRACENFPNREAFSIEWYRAVGLVKQACYLAYRSFKDAAQTHPNASKLSFIDNRVLTALEQAALEVSSGTHFDHFIVPAVQGGAGTSINLNINEIIANRALQLVAHKPGEYQFIDPIEHANIYQSTNDVIPTALRIAAIQLLQTLENEINNLRSRAEDLEKLHRHTLRVGYTQMQAAVPSSYGRLFSTWADAFSRDWWRVSKCIERIKEINLGGGAIGSGLAIPRFFIMEVTNELQKLSGLPIARSENMYDNTCNLDPFVEVHAIVKAQAVNLEKIVSDIRLLASDVCAGAELEIPQKQLGSTIMPGKVNPVIPEYVISVAHRVYANDMQITSLAALGTLELNPYLPSIGHALIDSLKLLISACQTTNANLLSELKVNDDKALENLYSHPSITTALSPYIGYHKAAHLARYMKTEHLNVFDACLKMNILNDATVRDILKSENVSKQGFSLNDF